MDYLFKVSSKLQNNTKSKFKRSLYDDIDFSQRLIEISGSRGVGKTILMLQKAKEIAKKSANSVIYMSLDDSYFFNNSIVETADKFQQYGGKYMFIDEVHKYPSKHKNYDWSSELKNIYDLYPELIVVYTGSSIIDLYKANGDLSRRKTSYKLNGLSFREYLSLNKVSDFDRITLSDIVDNHADIASNIMKELKILPHFKQYLNTGYFPFYNENPDQYDKRLKNIINLILEIDIPAITDLNHSTISKIKTMLAVLSTSVPYTPNLTQLSAYLNIADLRTMYKYFYYLEKAELITLLNTVSKSNSKFRKPAKIYLNNTNLIDIISTHTSSVGTVRETFFLNQLAYMNKVNFHDSADFIVNDKYIFEIGGKRKTRKQIAGLENAYVVKDDIEVGFGDIMPLWMFGLMY